MICLDHSVGYPGLVSQVILIAIQQNLERTESLWAHLWMVYTRLASGHAYIWTMLG